MPMSEEVLGAPLVIFSCDAGRTGGAWFWAMITCDGRFGYLISEDDEPNEESQLDGACFDCTCPSEEEDEEHSSSSMHAFLAAVIGHRQTQLIYNFPRSVNMRQVGTVPFFGLPVILLKKFIFPIL
jgi:hypothetical protein